MRRRSSARRLCLALAALGTVLALVAAGCGGSDDEAAPAETAPAETAPAETAPAETAPAETAPAETAPAETAATESPYGEGVAANGEFGENYDPDPATVEQSYISVDALPTDPAAKNVVLASLARAELPVDQDKAFECWQNDGCDTGTGGEITVGMFDGFCANVWREVTKMEMIMQALTYPEVGKIIYTCANLDTQKAISDVRSLISQGADVLVGYADAGDALIPVIKEATERGIPFSTYVGGVIGKPGEDYMMVIGQDLCELGKQFATIVNEEVGEGKVAFLGGTPGNTITPQWQDCEEAALGPGIELVGKADTNWTREGSLQATSAFIAKDPDLAAISFEYADGFVGAMRAYEAAGVPMDIVYTGSTDEMAVFCEAQKAANENFRMWHGSGFNAQIRASLTAGMMQLQGAEIPGTITVAPVLVESTYPDYGCNPDLPESASPASLVPVELFARMFPPE